MADYSQYFPQGATQEKDYSAYFPSANNQKVVTADDIPGMPKQGQAVPPNTAGGFANLLGPAEALLSLGSSVVSLPVGALAGVANTIRTGNIRGPESQKAAREGFDAVTQAMTYRPRSEWGQDIIGTAGGLLSESKLAGVNPAAPLMGGGVLASPALRQASGAVRNIQVPTMLRTPEPQMVGMGAAETALPAMRIERAQSLPVPINLTQGRATRDYGQLRFEEETMKNPELGAPLRERVAEWNRQIPQNIMAFADETGSVTGSRRATGEAVYSAISGKYDSVKGRVDAAYKAARESGAMQEPVNVAPLSEYLESRRSQFGNAGVLKSTLDDISERTKKTGGEVTINDLEEVRKGVVAASGKDPTNAHYGREINKLIDSLTEGKGGAEYRYARRLNTQFKNEFENTTIVDRILSNKPGTRDRVIALEDVSDQIVNRGSLDDVRAVRRTLQTAGPKGEQAWREIQGRTLSNLVEEISSNSGRDIHGNPISSPAKLNKFVLEMDKDGKLDFIYGKQGAQKLRDVNELAQDLMTSPPGVVNTSNTASVVLAALIDMVLIPMGASAPLATISRIGLQSAREAKTKKLVQKSLNPVANP